MPFGVVGRTDPGIAGFGDPSSGRGTFEANLGCAIVTNGHVTAYVCDSAATRPSSQITLGRLVIIIIITVIIRTNIQYCQTHDLAAHCRCRVHCVFIGRPFCSAIINAITANSLYTLDLQ